jgi:predicted kinase
MARGFVDTDIIDELEYDTPETVDANIDLFSDDSFYKAHPDKILGTPYTASGRFGEVTKYKGTIEVLSRIEANEDFIGADKALINPLASNFNDINIDAASFQPEIAQVIEQAINTSDQEVRHIIKTRAKKPKVQDEGLVKPKAETLSFYDIFRKYNPEISMDELKVYVWNKTQIGKPLSKYYVSLFEPDLFGPDENLRDTYRYQVSEEVISDWIYRGLLFYFKGKLVPSNEYLSGNMYDKKMQLNADRQYIVEKYGQGIYDRQLQAIDNAFKVVYDKRLTVGGERGLVILPISKFAAQFQIERIEELPEDGNFKIKRVTAASRADYGEPDILNDEGTRDYDRHVFETLSLRDAFNYWLMKFRPQLTQPISHVDIVKYYVQQSPIRIAPSDDSTQAVKEAEAKREKLKSSTQQEGDRLFKIFLETQLTPNDKVRLETQWNSDYNNFLPFNLNKIPVAFTMAKYVGGREEELRAEKREAIAFVMNNGTGILAYDVGVGKTPSAIFTISAFIDAGYCKRPLIVVPNQVYKQFIGEIKMFAPHIPVIEGYNLSAEYKENFIDADGNITYAPEGSITVMTYEGMELIGFTDATRDRMLAKMYDILNQGGASEMATGKKGEKKKASFLERLEMLVGKGLKGGMYNIEDFGFDFITYDEAHKMKKVFTSVKGEAQQDKTGKVTRGKNPYVISSGTPSSIGLKGFMLNQYILEQNNYKNILLLTATPFTNSPLEIFSMMSMVAYEQLRETDLYNIKNFFDTYIQTSTQLVINTKLKPQFKQVILGFNNLISLQSLIRRYILYKTGEDVGVVRPKKYVLPYVKAIEDGILVDLDEDKRIETYIGMTPMQKAMMDDIIAYVEKGGALGNVGDVADVSDDAEAAEDTTEAIEVDEDVLDSDQKAGVRTIRGLSFSRNLALSPYLYEFSGLGKNPTANQYITTSPKLSYVMGCIKSVRDYCLANNQPVAGQVIYMDRGIEYFSLIKKYLVDEIGYKEHEVGIIVSGLPKNGPRSKEYVKNLFNGEIYNEKTKEFEAVDDNQRIKVVIGSSTIKEGINLQKYGAVLYNCFIDWNPTDIQQLEGRIYRQKNTFGAVRIVNPLVIDSADIFLFQKLQEKTARLNTIWSSDGKTNVLHTEEFNPEELKYALIRDPRVIAELKTIEERSKLDSEKLGYERQIEIAGRVSEAASNIKYYFDRIVESIKDYRDFDRTDDMLADAERLVKTVIDLEKKQTDKDGKKILGYYERREASQKDRDAASPMEKQYAKPYYFSYFSVATRDMLKYMKTFINAYNIPFDLRSYEDALKLFKDGAEAKMKEIDEVKSNLESKEKMDALVDSIIQERERLKVQFKALPEIIADFSKLNYLLDKKTVVIPLPAVRYDTCPPTEANGSLSISPDGIKALNVCLSKESQTKDTYYNTETQEYLPERQKIHREIIDKLFEGVKCVTRKKPIAVFTGGPTASGKSTFLKNKASYLLNDDVFHLDADEIRAMLPEYKGWNANSTHLETQDIVNSILDKLGSNGCRYDFVYDGTMNKAKKYFELIKKVKAMGYETYIIFMEVPYADAKRRSLERYKRTGRYVPAEVIDDFFTEINGKKSKGQAALDELKPIVDGFIVADGITGKIIDKGGKALPQKRGDVYGADIAMEPATQSKVADGAAQGQQKPVEKPILKEKIEKLINALNLSYKFAPDSGQKDKIQKQIKALSTSLKFAA